jgi:glycosyltransferase involved in cell wall biosynthesis
MLERAIGSASSQLELGDEVIVVHDDAPHNDWGAWARAEAMKDARGSHLLFMDDDDEYLPRANNTIRKAIQPEPDRVHIFRMARTAPFNDVIWISQDLAQPGQVSTQMIVVPNDPDRLGTWSPRYEGDFDFLVSTLAKHHKPPVWHQDVIAIQHPNGY